MSWSAPLSSELQSLSYLSEKERDVRERNGDWTLSTRTPVVLSSLMHAQRAGRVSLSLHSRPKSYSLLRMTTRALVTRLAILASRACDITFEIRRTLRRPRSVQLSSQTKGKFELFSDKHIRWLLQLVWRNIKGHTEAHVGKTNLWLQSILLEIKGFILYIMRHTLCCNIQ